MIQSVQIQNFKSVVDLTLELGSFNVLIGANGCGKSNILEAIAFGAAASADKLDQEFLGSRGIRMTSPEFMFSAFSDTKSDFEIIRLSFMTVSKTVKEFSYQIIFGVTDGIKSKWYDMKTEGIKYIIKNVLPELEDENDEELKEKKVLEVLGENENTLLVLKEMKVQIPKGDNEEFFERLFKLLAKSDRNVSNYILYSPEQTSLRKFSDTNQIYPLGIKGEGLFQYLKELSQDEKNAEVLNEIKECLRLLDWYEDFNLPKNLMSNEFALSIKDKYLNENLQFFDQRSTNEGFLYLLFYATLFTSKDTPQFFAIDNIDASFNPKLCMQVTKMLANLVKKHGKQVIVTTQNPAILDGLDLQDDSQRLFVVRRNEEGHTKAKRIAYKAERTMKLSEVWTNGFIGGLPDNF